MTSRLTLQQVHELAVQALIASGGDIRQSAVIAQSITEAEAQVSAMSAWLICPLIVSTCSVAKWMVMP